MARGNDAYLFENGNEVRLITILCSDAFAFADKVDANYENLLLLHLQMNENPRSEPFMRYRRRLYDFDNDQTEVICLNWAEKFTYDVDDASSTIQKNNISASAWHSKSKRFATMTPMSSTITGSGCTTRGMLNSTAICFTSLQARGLSPVRDEGAALRCRGGYFETTWPKDNSRLPVGRFCNEVECYRVPRRGRICGDDGQLWSPCFYP